MALDDRLGEQFVTTQPGDEWNVTPQVKHGMDYHFVQSVTISFCYSSFLFFK